MYLFHCTKKMSSFKDFLNKCEQIRSFIQIWSHSLTKSVNEEVQFLCSA